MRLTPRTVFLLCTLLLGMQLGALSHASEHIQDLDHQVCQLCSFNDRSHDQISNDVVLLHTSKAQFLPTAFISTGIQSQIITVYNSRAPPQTNTHRS